MYMNKKRRSFFSCMYNEWWVELSKNKWHHNSFHRKAEQKHFVFKYFHPMGCERLKPYQLIS